MQEISGINYKWVIYTFFLLKLGFCFYLYSEILAHLIYDSVHKLHRKLLGLMLTILKSFLHALLFTIMLPLLYFTLQNQAMQAIEPFNHALTFWILAGF